MAISKEFLWNALDTVVAEFERIDPQNVVAARARGLLDSKALVPKAEFDRHKRSLRAERDDEAARLYLNGLSLLDVARELGIAAGTVRAALKRRNIMPRPPGKCQKATILRRDDEKADRIAAMRAEGKTLTEIGDIEGITRERVRQILARAGIDGPRPLSPNEREAVEQYAGGASLYDAAIKHNLTQHTLRKLILRNGGELRPSRRNGGSQPATMERAKQVAKLYLSGSTIQQIMTSMGIRHAPSVYRLLALANVELRRRRSRKEAA